MSFFQELTDREHVFEFLTQVQSPVDVRHGPILYLEDVNVSFDGFKAINNLNLTIDDGELRCIIGPNGAGKTTMMDIITGKTRPDTGSVWFGSRHNLLTMNEPDIASLGIGRKFQKPTVFEALTVFENLELAMAADKRVFPTLTAVMKAEYRDRIDEVLEMIGLESLRDRLAGKQSVVVVEHDMGFVRSIARKVTVLHQGSVLAEGSMDQVSNDPEVIKVYLGEEA